MEMKQRMDEEKKEEDSEFTEAAGKHIQQEVWLLRVLRQAGFGQPRLWGSHTDWTDWPHHYACLRRISKASKAKDLVLSLVDKAW